MDTVRLRKTLLIVSIGPLEGLVEVAGLLASYRTAGMPVDVQGTVWAFIGSCLWGLYLPLIVHWCERDPLRHGQLGRQLPRHFARSLFISVAVAATIGLVRWAAHAAIGTVLLTPRELLTRLLQYWMLFDAFGYAVLLGVVSAFAAQRKLRLAELDAARFETALARTEMKLLKAELDPHFIFNALHTINSLVPRDPEAARTMICRLSDFLRLSLATTGAQEVPLQRELEHLESYMAIQRVRFRGRLFVETDVPTELLACQVPNLLLQPLVENVVKHAVAPTQRPVHARLTARRDADRLVLELTDDGPGIAAGAPPREGVGLSNTRGRLRKLYETRHVLRLENRAQGGLTVRVELPHVILPRDLTDHSEVGELSQEYEDYVESAHR